MFKGFGDKLLGFGCLWAVLMFVSFILGLAYQGLTGQKEDLGFLYTLAIPLAVALAVVLAILSPRAERREKERKAEAERRESEERKRRRELEREYYRQNPERLVSEICSYCNMQIPAFARICPYCRSNLREEK